MLKLLVQIFALTALSQPLFAFELRKCSVLISEVKENTRSFGTIAFVANYESSYFLVFDVGYLKSLNSFTRCMIQVREGVAEYGLGEFLESKTVHGYKSYPACCVKISKRFESECADIAVRLSSGSEIRSFPKRLYANSVLLSERTKSAIGLPFVSVPVDIIGEFNTRPPHVMGERILIAAPVTLPNISPVVEELDGEFLLQGLLFHQQTDLNGQPAMRWVLSKNRLVDCLRAGIGVEKND